MQTLTLRHLLNFAAVNCGCFLNMGSQIERNARHAYENPQANRLSVLIKALQRQVGILLTTKKRGSAEKYGVKTAL